MNRNILKEENYIDDISNALQNLATKEEVSAFLNELLTNSEIQTLSKRWRILHLLKKGKTQREISQLLGVSLCKVTRGAKIIKDKKSIVNKTLEMEN